MCFLLLMRDLVNDIITFFKENDEYYYIPEVQSLLFRR